MNEADLPLKHSTTEFSKIGEKLRYARESRGLSQQEVSRALCLSISIVDALEREAHRILDLVVAEWNSDPMSIQCFDLRIVERAKAVMSRLKQLTPEWER